MVSESKLRREKALELTNLPKRDLRPIVVPTRSIEDEIVAEKRIRVDKVTESIRANNFTEKDASLPTISEQGT